MAHPKLRGFTGIRKDLTVQTERTIETKTQALNKKGEPIIENGNLNTMYQKQLLKKIQ